MTYLTIAQSVAQNAGIRTPTTMQATTEDTQKLAQFINEAGREIARRVDWPALRKVVSLAGTGALSIGSDFARLCEGLSVTHESWPIRGSLTQDEWFSLKPTVGEPRYFFLSNGSLFLYPHLRGGESISCQYISANWAMHGGSTSQSMAFDDATGIVPEKLIEAGAVWRWRRHVGKPFSDHLAEFEAMLGDLAKAHGGVRFP